MSNVRKSLPNVLAAIMGVFVLASISVWQFYKFATFSGTTGSNGPLTGTAHLIWAIVMCAFACFASFLVFSVFLKHDHNDDLHVTMR